MVLNKPNTKDDAPAVPLACGVCRERHLKCDGLMPSCSRCLDSRQKCFYVQSRRGHRPTRKRQRSDESPETPVVQSEVLEATNGIGTNATTYIQNVNATCAGALKCALLNRTTGNNRSSCCE